MTRIAIVGGGQAGMPLALGLLDKGYDVTVATNRKPDEVRAGQVMSSQCIFDPALRIERDLGIDEWAMPVRLSRASASPCRIPSRPAPRPSTGPRRWTARPRPWTSA